MWEPFFGFKKTPFSDNPDGKQLFASQGWNQVNARLQFLVEHHAIGLLTGEVGAGKSTAARSYFTGQQTDGRSEEHTSELQSQSNLVCRLLLEKKKKKR